ncbi:hypothetical protein ACEWY4_027788 [Coilia grayii]|uniref:Uncharacterized protein n=1 Tax=Coilia grayii TaxID=363190 RepID=A0ABD1INQ3_9TELE
MSEADVFKLICGNGGAMVYERLLDLVSGFPDIDCSKFDSLIGNKEGFFLTETGGVKQVLAKTNLRLCRVRDCGGCKDLHLCKFYLHGECKGRRCRYGHDLNSDHNAKVLSDHQLQKLNRAEIRHLLLQNDTPHSLLPPVCARYNRGDDEYGQCDDKDNCDRLHICEGFIRGTCDAGTCGRSHDFFEPHPLKTLRGRGVSSAAVGSMWSVYRNVLLLRGPRDKDGRAGVGSATGGKGRGGRTGKGRASSDNAGDGTVGTKHGSCPAQPETNEICLSFVKGYCKNEDRCFRVHSKMPYQWQIKTGNTWTDLPNNEDIERDFCNPSYIIALSVQVDPVHFDSLTCGGQEVRRLSTASSVRLPDFILTTEWLWYWEEEQGKWTPYTSRMSSVSSEDLEKRFQADNKDVILFTGGKQPNEQQYELSFKDMTQRNLQYGTLRNIRRRPRFISSDGVQTARTSKRRGPASAQPGRGVPGYWDKTAVPDTGYQKVTLLSTDRDYLKVQDLFSKTLRGFDMVSIERVQNKELWEDFQTKRERMKKANKDKKYGDGVRLLFHGTDSKFIDAICFQNFDWRKCGANGTVYGEGCYFARDASYSHNYTSAYGKRSMFVCRVLVGSYTRGQSHYRLPPSIDGGLVLYDSCVNDVRDPSIFVVFDKQQVYPEFLVTYTEHVRPPLSLVLLTDSSSSDTSSAPPNFLSPIKTTVTSASASTQSYSTSSFSAVPSVASAPKTVTVSTLSSTASASPSASPAVSGPPGAQNSGSVGTTQTTPPSSWTVPANQISSPGPLAVNASSSPTVVSPSTRSSLSSATSPFSPPQSSMSSGAARALPAGSAVPARPATVYRYSSTAGPPTQPQVPPRPAPDVPPLYRYSSTAAGTSRASPPHLSTTTASSYTHSRPASSHSSSRGQDLYNVPTAMPRWNEKKKKDECVLL